MVSVLNRKPEGYPFFRIAKQYGVDYSVVLKAADELKNTGRTSAGPFFDLGIDPRIMLDLAEATDIQQAIRDGRIDWQTGDVIEGDKAPYYPAPVEQHPEWPGGDPEPGTLAYAQAVHDDMTDPAPKAGETEAQARARRDYYRGYDDDGLPSD
jgi:hypothetical protein